MNLCWHTVRDGAPLREPALPVLSLTAFAALVAVFLLLVPLPLLLALSLSLRRGRSLRCLTLIVLPHYGVTWRVTVIPAANLLLLLLNSGIPLP
jgi:hypothetical protein